MRMKKAFIGLLAALSAHAGYCAVTVTASRDYVDRKVAVVSNDLEAAVSNLNERIDGITTSEPVSYVTVSNKAMNALSRQEAIDGFTEWMSGEREVHLIEQPKIVDYGGSRYWQAIYEVSGSVETNLSDEVASEDDTNFTVSDGVFPFYRVRMPTMSDLDGKASTNALGIAVSNLNERIDNVSTPDYANVSNKAMNALSRQEAIDGFTEWVCTNVITYAGESHTLNVVTVQDTYYILEPSPQISGWTCNMTNINLVADGTQMVFHAMIDMHGFNNLIATRTRLPTMADLDGKASTNDVQLMPVYGGNGKKFGDWETSDQAWSVEWNNVNGSNGWCFVFIQYGLRYLADSPGYSDINAKMLTFSQSGITATRAENEIIGYTLGMHTNDVFVSTNGLKIAVTNLEDNISGKASTNDVFLTPCGMRYTEWRYEWQDVPPSTESDIYDFRASYSNGVWTFTPIGKGYDQYPPTDVNGQIGSTNLTFRAQDADDSEWYDVIATRSSIYGGYTLGSQTDKVIPSKDADTSYLRYSGSTTTNINQSVQYVSITDQSTSTLQIMIPNDGRTKDWIVYVTSVTNVHLSLPSATWWMTDTAYTNDIAPATPTALYFTEATNGVFVIGRQEFTPITIP